MKDFNDILNSDFLNSGISDELLAAYIEGNATMEECSLIENSLNNDPLLSEAIEIANNSTSIWDMFDTYKMGITEDNHLHPNFSELPFVDESEDITIRQTLNNEYINNLDSDFMEKKEMPSITIPPAAGYAAYKLWKSYNNGSLSFNKEVSPNSGHPESVGNHQDNFVGAKPAETAYGQEELNIPYDPQTDQYYPDTCAIQSQRIVLEQFGINVTQEEMIEVAKMNGWYAEGFGTPLNCVGKLLEYYGVDVDATEGNNIFNLANELSKGHHIIVSVDSGELVNPESEANEDLLYGERADHALVVVGIDTTNPDDVKVIVTDPGTGAKQWAYSEKEFVEAWKDSNCYMVSTDQSPQEHSGGEPFYKNDFAGIPVNTWEKMAEIDLSTSHDYMDAIVESFMNNPEGWINVIDEYPNIFNYDNEGAFHIFDPVSGVDLTMTSDDLSMMPE